jgi:hypothetical protein
MTGGERIAVGRSAISGSQGASASSGPLGGENPLAYAAMAAGLAVPGDPIAATDEVGWQVRRVSPGARDVLPRLPPPRRSGGVLAALISDLHAKLTEGGWICIIGFS